MVYDVGDSLVSEADDMNIPVNCFLFEPEEGSQMWTWSAANFMPRKGWVAEDEYKLRSTSKEEILDLIRRTVIPLYEAAIKNLKTGTNYYWDGEE